MNEHNLHNLNNVSETLLIPLYIRACESQRPDALMRDEAAVELVKKINYDFSKIKLQNHDKVGIIMRVRQFDRFAKDFLTHQPQSVVVHIGCGLDNRFERLDNGQVIWYDLDLPEVIELRRNLFCVDSGRYHQLACSVFDPGWIDQVSQHRPIPFLFIAEGVFPYFSEVQLKALVLKLRDHFPGAELVFDAHTPFIIWADNLQLIFSRMKARLQWGLKHSQDLETWGEGIRLVEQWYYFDQLEPRMGASNWMRHIPFLAKSTGIFHYRLLKPD
jgi:O-methyltransferase involved in polyketide biosynthesis